MTLKYDILKTPHGKIIMREDGACIPRDMENRDYVEYRGWCKENGVDPVLTDAEAQVADEAQPSG